MWGEWRGLCRQPDLDKNVCFVVLQLSMHTLLHASFCVLLLCYVASVLTSVRTTSGVCRASLP